MSNDQRNSFIEKTQWISIIVVMNYCILRFLEVTSFGFEFSQMYRLAVLGSLAVVGVPRFLLCIWGEYRNCHSSSKSSGNCSLVPSGRFSASKGKLIAKILLLAVFGISSVIVELKFGHTLFIYLFFTVLCLYDVDSDVVLKAFVAVIGTMLATTAVCSLAGVTENYLYPTTGLFRHGYLRSSYGIGYPTDFASFFVYLLLFFWASGKRKPVLPMLALIALAIYFIYKHENSITSILSLTVTAVFVVYEAAEYRFGQKNQKLLSITGGLATAIFPVMTVVFFVVTWFYGQGASFAKHLDSVISGRFSLAWRSIQTYGIHLFGAATPQIGSGGGDFPKITGTYDFLDSTYGLLLIRYGVVLALLLIIAWVWTTRKALKCGNRTLAYAMVVIAIHSFSEHHFPEVNYNILVAMPFCLFKELLDEEQADTVEKRITRWIPWIVEAAVAGICVLFAPAALSRLRTIVGLKGWGTLPGLLFIILLVILVIVLAALLIWLIRADLNRLAIRKLLAMFIAAVCLLVSLAGYTGVIVANARTQRTISGAVDSVSALSGQADSGQVDSGQTDQGWADSDQIDLGQADSGQTDQGQANSDQIDSGQVDSGQTDQGQADSTDSSHVGSYSDSRQTADMQTVDQQTTGTQQIDERLKADDAALEIILASASEPVYVDKYEEFYRENHDGISGHIRSLQELSCLREGTILTECAPEAQKLIARGAIYSEISDYTSVYTYDRDVVKALQDAGYICHGYYYTENCLDNIELAKLSGMELSDTGALVLESGDSMTETPSVALYAGSYRLILSASSEVPVVQPEGGCVCTFSVMSEDGETEFYKRDIHAEEFNETGHSDAACDFYIGANSRVRFEIKANIPLEVGRISWARNASTDVWRKYDELGRVLEESYYTLDGEPLVQPRGYAAVRYEYEEGQDGWITLRYLDEQGSPVMICDGYSAIERSFDQDGHVLAERYLDAEGNPTLMCDGYSAIERSYDQEGHVLTETYLDENGTAINGINGYAKTERAYDSEGRMTAQKYYDENDQPVKIYTGYAEIRREYDEEGRVHREDYYDVDGTLAVMPAGHSGFEQEYDEEGNLISRKYQNGGNLLNRIDGYAEARWIKNAETGACDLTFIDAAGSEVSSNGLNLARDIPGDDENWSAWMRPSYNAVNSCMSIGRLNLGEKLAGDVYTCQIEIEFKGVQATQGQDFRFWTQGSADGDWYKGNVWTSNLTYLDTPPEDGIYSFTVTNAVNENMVGVSNFDMGFRCDNWSAGYFRVRKIKVEKGDQVSEWSPGV